MTNEELLIEMLKESAGIRSSISLLEALAIVQMVEPKGMISVDAGVALRSEIIRLRGITRDT